MMALMKTHHKPLEFTIIEHCLIPMDDGRQLSARLWLPDGVEHNPVPAIVEYLPYRKRDATVARDNSTYPVFAQAGYAGVRVDIAGTGESDGIFDDEYSERELSDGVAVIEWVAAQPWCTGKVGMMGISWGGFNSLQIAALQPKPLHAVIAIGTTVDRYNDDIHYKNGCLLNTNFWWSNVMACYIARPPDPELLGSKWRALWKLRLRTQPFPLEHWLAHPRRDAYWRHGSVGEQYSDMHTPALVISGWADGYKNAPPNTAAHFSGCTKAINGPWMHHYPHFALPHPRLDFHQEAIKWWDHWLKDVDNGAAELPAYRAYIAQNIRPESPERDTEAGYWVAEPVWPSPDITATQFNPNHTGGLTQNAVPDASVSICSPLDCGTACGEFFPLQTGAELSGDQRTDDAGSLVFDTPPLSEALEILGRPVLQVRVAIDQPTGYLAVRLVDVHPDGVGHRVSWGVLNLAHRSSYSEPSPVTQGQAVDITIVLDECGYKFLPNHKIRLALSTSYWPMIMPPPAIVTATVTLGENTFFKLPVRNKTNGTYPVSPPHDPNTLPVYPLLREPHNEREITRDLHQRTTLYRVRADTGETKIPEHGMCLRHHHESTYTVAWDDPLRTRAHSVYTSLMSRDNWQVRVQAESTLTVDAQFFYLRAKVTAYENGRLASERHWQKAFPRDML